MNRLLFDITHPSYVHLYKNIIRALRDKGYKAHVTTQDNNNITTLLNKLNLSYTILGAKAKGIAGKVFNQIKLNYKLWAFIRNNKIDLVIGGSTTVAHGSYFTKAKSIVFTDDDGDVIPLFAKSTYPFADIVINPICIRDRIPEKQILVNSYKELAYLHPNQFKPEINALFHLGLSPQQPYIIVRFSALNAHHDLFATGIQDKIELVRFLEKYGKVFVCSESTLPSELLPNQLKAPEELMHSILYYASLYIGDSQTMAAEAAVLGTPSIRQNSFVGKLSYLEELEKKYNLTFGFLPEDNAGVKTKVIEILEDSSASEKWQNKRKAMLAEKDDLTKWFVDFIESESWNK